MNNNNNNNNNNDSQAAYRAFLAEKGVIIKPVAQQSSQKPRQQKMQRPAQMQRPAPIDALAVVARQQAQERSKIVSELKPMHRMVAVGSADSPCVLVCPGVLASEESLRYLKRKRKDDSDGVLPPRVPVEGVMTVVEAPVAAPVAKPAYRKDSGRAKRKVRVVEVDAPWLDPKAASKAYVESIAWRDRCDAEWTATKVQLAEVDMIKSAKGPTPAELLAGPGLSFKAAHELLRRRHVVAEVAWVAVDMEGDGGFLILSQEAMKDPLSPWRTRINIDSLAEAAAKEAAEELAGLKQAHEVRRALVRAESQVAAELRAEAQAIVDAELAHEAREAAMLAHAEDQALLIALTTYATAKTQQAAYEEMLAEWKRARAISRVKARMAALAEAKKDSKPDLVEERRADIGEYAAFKAAWKPASRISGSRDSNPVHKGQPKVVSKRDVGVVVDPNMVGKVAFDKAANRPYVSPRSGRVLDHVEEQMEKRQVADLIGPKVAARRVR